MQLNFISFVCFSTYVTILATSAHPSVDTVDVALCSNNQRGSGIHNSLATAITSHNLAVDSHTGRDSAVPVSMELDLYKTLI